MQPSLEPTSSLPVNLSRLPGVTAELTYETEVFTGVRPTGDLTVANYLGAINPTRQLQERGLYPRIFVADLHAITDQEPALARKYLHEIVANYLAAGIDPEKSDIFIQSSIAKETHQLMMYFARYVTVNELLRVPSLKDKVPSGHDVGSVSTSLGLYPVLMAADIALQQPKLVPVGQDQIPHIELTKRIIRKMNSAYGTVLLEPQPLEVNPLRILSLDGGAKMSKSRPKGAIFLTDSAQAAAKKIDAAVTAPQGEMSRELQSMVTIGTELARNDDDRQALSEILAAHLAGKLVMGSFKVLLKEIVSHFLQDFQEKKRAVLDDSSRILSTTLEKGEEAAYRTATKTLNRIEVAMHR